MKILLITKYFPPANTIASHRVYSFAKFLPEYGIEIEIITPSREGNLNLCTDGMTIHHPYKAVEKLNSFVRPSNRIKKLLKHMGIRVFRRYFISEFYKKSLHLLTFDFIKKYDAIFASFGPEDVLRLAYKTSKKYHIPLIIDYRDLWLDNKFSEWTLLDKIVIFFIEKKIIKKAALVITVSRTLSEQIKQRYQINSKIVYNGYWDVPQTLNYSTEGITSLNSFKFCYCGSLYGGIRPIHLIFPILARQKNYKLDIAVFDQYDIKLLQNLRENYNVVDQVSIYKNLSHDEALALESKADVLLFLNTLDGNSKGVLSGKLFEYMQTGKFILGIGNHEDEAAQLIRENSLGGYAHTVEEISDILKRINDWNKPARGTIASFSRENQVKTLATEIKKTFV